MSQHIPAQHIQTQHLQTQQRDPFASLRHDGGWTVLDELTDPDQRWSTWLQVEALQRGPEPRPDWVVTSQGAVDTEMGVLKTGKEADVFLVERRDPRDSGPGALMAAKRYRTSEHSSFHRSASYTEGRKQRRSRDQRAMERKSSYGREVAAGQWAVSEWNALVRCWELGLPVPYPVQLDGTEILMEWVSHEGASAARLARARPSPTLLADWYEQLRAVLSTLTRAGYAHGDLSAYNILVAGRRLVVIDLPQVIDLAANPRGHEFLARDCRNVCSWFSSRGLDVDADALFAEVVAQAF